MSRRPIDAAGGTVDERGVLRRCVFPLCTLVVGALAASCASPTPAPVAPPVEARPAVPPLPFSTQPATATLHLIHVGDTEAGMLADDMHGGVARAAALIGALSRRSGRALVVHAGDTIIPSPELSLELALPSDAKKKQSALITANNAHGLHVAALGNHDFDLGEAALADNVQRSTFPWVATTLMVGGGPLQPLVDDTPRWLDDAAGRGRILRRARHCLGERRGDGCEGVTVGVVAAVPESLRVLSAGATTSSAPVDVRATVAALQPAVDALRSEGAGIVVLLSHRQGVENDFALLQAGLVGIDVVVSGGGENRLVPPGHRVRDGAAVDPLCRREARGCYPVWRVAQDGAPVALVATDGGLHTVGALDLSFDDKGVAVAVESTTRPWAIDEESLLELRAELDRSLLGLELATRDALAPLQEVLGEVDVWLEGRRELVRNGETNLGSLSADALLRAARASHADVVAAFRNGGAIRDSIGIVTADGRRLGKAVTLLDLKGALRFDSAVVVVELSHADLARTVEAALVGAGTGQGRFPQVSSGVELRWSRAGRDQTQEVKDGRVVGVVTDGTRLVRLVVPGPTGPVLVVDAGVVVSPAARLKIATIDYLGNGGDGWFPGLKPTLLPTSATEHAAFRALLGDAGATRQSLAVTGRVIAVD